LPQVGQIIINYSKKFSFHKLLLTREDFNDIAFDVMGAEALVLFDHLTSLGSEYKSIHLRCISGTEFILSCLLLCSPELVSIEERLDSCMCFCQFRLLSEKSVYFMREPTDLVSKEQVLFFVETSCLVLSKLAGVSPPNFDHISEEIDSIFNGDDRAVKYDDNGNTLPEFSNSIPSSKSKWSWVLLCLLCNYTFVKFINAFVEVINLREAMDDIVSVLNDVKEDFMVSFEGFYLFYLYRMCFNNTPKLSSRILTQSRPLKAI
jgi:hypothetical protein